MIFKMKPIQIPHCAKIGFEVPRPMCERWASEHSQQAVGIIVQLSSFMDY
uniref:Uncharacterized protein n=1 Tax=Anguilla anguilla TaxID=7936 RepID=A0A0E9VG25_ANGAN